MSGTYGVRLSVRTFPAKGFAAAFSDAVKRKAAPDLLVFDNYGILTGITTRLGRFDGIAQDPEVKKNLIHVTYALNDLLWPARGWVYLFTPSLNHEAARGLALRPPECTVRLSQGTSQSDLAHMVRTTATAFVKKDWDSLKVYGDPDRMPEMTARKEKESVDVISVQPCGVWGNDKFAVALVNTSYQGETALGHAPALLVLRKTGSQWRLVRASRDPISTTTFVKQMISAGTLLTQGGGSRTALPATLLSPSGGGYAVPPSGQRFGDFVWRASRSNDVVMEIAEFAYLDDARLVLTRTAGAGATRRISAGVMWGPSTEWRIWSVTRTGDIAFSEARMAELRPGVSALPR